MNEIQFFNRHETEKIKKQFDKQKAKKCKPIDPLKIKAHHETEQEEYNMNGENFISVETRKGKPKAHHKTDKVIDPNFDLFKEKTANPLDLAKEYYFWAGKIEEASKKLDENKKKIKVLEQNLYEAMMESGLKSLTLFDKKIKPSFQYWASIPEEKSEAGFPQIREMGLGDLIKNKVNSQTFSVDIRILIKEGRCVKSNIIGEGWLLDGKPVEFNIVKKKIISITKG